MEESVNFLTFYKETFGLKRADAATYSPLVLAYIGDAVYELMIRTRSEERRVGKECAI